MKLPALRGQDMNLNAIFLSENCRGVPNGMQSDWTG